MKYVYLSVLKEKGDFDFEVSAMIQELSQEDYRELKSMLITVIGSMEQMRRDKDLDNSIKSIDKVLGGSDE